MVKIICVTGSVGTGKTRFAENLAKKKNYKYLNLTDFVKKNKLTEYYDRKRKTYDIDIKKLNKALIKYIKDSKENLIIDGHLSHYLPKKYVDLCCVCKTDLKKLKKRLERRKYNKLKIQENLECEIFDVCLNEARELKHKIKIIYT